MQHIQGQNYVGERLRDAKREKPGALAWSMLIGLTLAGIGMVGFFSSIFVSILFHYNQVWPTGMVFWAICVAGALVFSISSSLRGINPRRATLRRLIEEFRGGSAVGRLEAGLQGEQEVRSALAAALDDQWVLFSGVVIEGIWGDIDHILIGPAGVFVIEAKNWSGRIEYDDERRLWYRVSERSPNGEILKDPAEQAVQAAGMLQDLLGQRVKPVVVFTNRNAVYKGDHPTTLVFLLYQLVPWLQSQPQTLTSAEVNSLVAKMKQIMKIG